MVETSTNRAPMPAAWVRRYLDHLGLERAEPSLPALADLTRAHLLAVPFENVSAILRRQAHPGQPVPALDPEVLLRAWEQGHGGGVCFEVAAMLERLLVGLGYRAHAVLGLISFLGSHQAVLVELDGQRYLVDPGNGAPFFEPIPLSGVVEVRRAGLAYRFRPGDEPTAWLQERWVHGEWVPFCRYDLRPPDQHVRAAAYQRHHTPGASWVVDNLVLIRCADDEVFVLRDGEFTRYRPGGKHTAAVAAVSDYARLAADVFRLPALPIEAALRARSTIGARTDA